MSILNMVRLVFFEGTFISGGLKGKTTIVGSDSLKHTHPNARREGSNRAAAVGFPYAQESLSSRKWVFL